MTPTKPIYLVDVDPELRLRLVGSMATHTQAGADGTEVVVTADNARVYGPLTSLSLIVIGADVPVEHVARFRRSLHALWKAYSDGPAPMVTRADAEVFDVTSDTAAAAVAREREKLETVLADAAVVSRALASELAGHALTQHTLRDALEARTRLQQFYEPSSQERFDELTIARRGNE